MKNKLAFAICLAFLALAVSFAQTGQQQPAQQQPAPSGSQQQPPAPPANKGAGPYPTPEQATEMNIQMMRQDIRAERKKIVAANLPLTADEATRFWPVYDRYIGETIKVNDERWALVKNYAKNFDTLTDAQANSYIKSWLALDGDNTQLRLKYIPEFEKAISPKKTAMFFQIDRRVGMVIELQLASQVPLVQP